jgi:hypothetical protein
MNYYKIYFILRHTIAMVLAGVALVQIKNGTPVSGLETFLIGMFAISWFEAINTPDPKDKNLFKKEDLIEKKDLDELSKTAREKISEQSGHIQLLKDRVALLENLIDTKRYK